MHPLVIAKRRSLRRRHQGGAAMFIVAMTIAVLASVGVYALAAASTELRTAGNERQNTQTHYLSEYGVLGSLHEFVGWKAEMYKNLMVQKPELVCVSLPGVPSTANGLERACRRVPDTELGDLGKWNANGATMTAPYTGNAPYAPGVPPGSFGATPTTGGFFVELTNPHELSPPALYSMDNHICFVQLTVTTTGVTKPTFVWQKGAADLTTGQFGGAGYEMQRARIVAGPVTCEAQARSK
jgi:hypothetical protein